MMQKTLQVLFINQPNNDKDNDELKPCTVGMVKTKIWHDCKTQSTTPTCLDHVHLNLFFCETIDASTP